MYFTRDHVGATHLNTGAGMDSMGGNRDVGAVNRVVVDELMSTGPDDVRGRWLERGSPRWRADMGCSRHEPGIDVSNWH